MDKRVHKQQMDVLATLYRVAYDEQDACTIKLAAEDTESKYSDKEYLGFPKIYGRNRKFAVVSNNKTRCQGVPLSEIIALSLARGVQGCKEGTVCHNVQLSSSSSSYPPASAAGSDILD